MCGLERGLGARLAVASAVGDVIAGGIARSKDNKTREKGREKEEAPEAW